MSEENIVRYVRPPGGYVMPDEQRQRLDAMTEDDIMAAAMADPDCPLMTEEQLSRMKRVTVARSARWRSGMTQSAFAEAFGFTVDRLRDLEQGDVTPDAATDSYLRLIQLDAQAVLEMLSRTPEKAA